MKIRRGKRGDGKRAMRCRQLAHRWTPDPAAPLSPRCEQKHTRDQRKTGKQQRLCNIGAHNARGRRKQGLVEHARVAALDVDERRRRASEAHAHVSVCAPPRTRANQRRVSPTHAHRRSGDRSIGTDAKQANQTHPPKAGVAQAGGAVWRKQHNGARIGTQIGASQLNQKAMP